MIELLPQKLHEWYAQVKNGLLFNAFVNVWSMKSLFTDPNSAQQRPRSGIQDARVFYIATICTDASALYIDI